MNDMDIVDEITHLKRRADATILAHYYQEGEIQDVADVVGDSLALARAARQVRTGTVVLCGVHFMAETAKMLNPGKRVLMPDIEAGCSLVESCPAPHLARYQQKLRDEGRHFQTVAYVNTSAAVKALADCVVTSGTAVQAIERLPADDEILFVPDRHLGQYLGEVTGRRMILWDGSCVVHEVFSVQDLVAMKRRLPLALTIAHPECPSNVRERSDYVGGSEGMLRFVESREAPADFLVATEPNMMWQLERRFPRHRYHPVPGVACSCNKCPHMGRNSLEKLRDCLAHGGPEVSWAPEFDRAREVVERSLLKQAA